MRLHSSLTSILGSGLRWITARAPAALFLMAATAATGCGGCDDATVQCDANGENCEVCDAYGCHPAEPGTGSGGSGQGGATGAGGSGGSAPACDPAVTTCPCDAEGACPEGTQCIEGLCLAGCDFSYECGPGKVCANGQCALGCDDGSPCPEAGTTCENGVCVVDPLNPACSDQTPCAGAGEICVDGVCATGCATHADCAAGEVCNAATGACILDPSPQPGCGAVGAACGGVGQQCMADGYCHYPCTTVEACQLIDNRFIACDTGICKTEEEVSPECTIEDPCPAGQDCISNSCL
jgi:hypothetical protein